MIRYKDFPHENQTDLWTPGERCTSPLLTPFFWKYLSASYTEQQIDDFLNEDRWSSPLYRIFLPFDDEE